MSEIIEYIISCVIAYLLALAISLPIAYIQMRKLDKHISNKMSTFQENRAALERSHDESHARSQSQDEVSAQVDELDESADELDEDIDEIGESADEISESTGEIHESSDEKDESSNEKDEYIEGLIEFTRIMRDYSDYKTKMFEARENFREPEFSDEKNIH